MPDDDSEALRPKFNRRNGILKTILLNLIYVAAILIAVPFLLYRAIRYGKNRRGWWAKLSGRVSARPDRTENRKCIWFHAVSVGEINLLGAVLERLQQRLPDWHFAISTTTETGYSLALNRYPDYQVFFCPIDFSWAVNQVLRRLNPGLVVLAELELWPNIVRQSHQHSVPMAIINGRLGESSYAGYQRVQFLINRILAKIDLIAVQNESYGERFRNLGARSKTVVRTGSIKFDGAMLDKSNCLTQKLTKQAGLTDDDFVFVAGSTQPNEDRIAVDVWLQLVEQNPNLKLILVPRHPHKAVGVIDYLSRKQIPFALRSERSSERDVGDKRVLVVDVIGELGGWWGCANVAYVGGSMCSRGGQSMIEPAAFGVPVSFGPNTKNFKDVAEVLLAERASRVVRNQDELVKFVEWAIADRAAAEKMGDNARAVVLRQQGAADSTVDLILELLSQQAVQVLAAAAA